MELANYPTDFPSKAIEIVFTALVNPSSLKDKKTLQTTIQAVYTIEGFLLGKYVGSPTQLVGANIDWMSLLTMVITIIKAVLEKRKQELPVG